MGWFGPLLSIIGAFSGANSNRAAGSAATDQQNQINQQIENMLKTLGGNANTAEGFFQNEANQGLDPAVIGAADTNFTNSFERQMNTIMNQLGGSTPNPAGLANDLNFQGVEGMATLNSNLAGQNQQFKNQAMQDYFNTALGLSQETSSALNPIRQGAQQAAGAAASAPNPFGAAGAAIAGIPNSFWQHIGF